ncbi:MAG: hypothetical protein NTZ17_14715 [Phycisphaerae bacterium]|nr:hypothetical protein [Phycisphaerae bacterium]
MAENVRELPPPVLLAALVCDVVILDALTGKGTVVGIFDVLNAPTYPIRHDRLFVFCQLTNGRGSVDIHTKFVDLEDDEKVIFENTVKAKFADVREVANVVSQFLGLVFPHPGEYRVQVFAGTDFLGERRILCKLITGQPGGKTDAEL